MRRLDYSHAIPWEDRHIVLSMAVQTFNELSELYPKIAIGIRVWGDEIANHLTVTISGEMDGEEEAEYRKLVVNTVYKALYSARRSENK